MTALLLYPAVYASGPQPNPFPTLSGNNSAAVEGFATKHQKITIYFIIILICPITLGALKR